MPQRACTWPAARPAAVTLTSSARGHLGLVPTSCRVEAPRVSHRDVKFIWAQSTETARYWHAPAAACQLYHPRRSGGAPRCHGMRGQHTSKREASALACRAAKEFGMQFPARRPVMRVATRCGGGGGAGYGAGGADGSAAAGAEVPRNRAGVTRCWQRVPHGLSRGNHDKKLLFVLLW